MLRERNCTWGSVLILGNLGTEQIYRDGNLEFDGIGGTLPRIAITLATLGVKSIILGSSTQHDSSYEKVEVPLTAELSNNNMVHEFLRSATLRNPNISIPINFEIHYNSKNSDDPQMDKILVENPENQHTVLDNLNEGFKHLKEKAAQGDITLSYVCPLPVQVQFEIVGKLIELNIPIALSSHFSLIDKEGEKETGSQFEVSELLSAVDYLSVSEDEAKRITYLRNTSKSGKTLSLMLKKDSIGIVLVTKGSQGAEVFREGKLLAELREPFFPGKVVDVTGAGDVFFSTFVSLLNNYRGEKSLSRQNLAKALLYAQIMVEYKLGTYSFLKIFDLDSYISGEIIQQRMKVLSKRIRTYS